MPATCCSIVGGGATPRRRALELPAVGRQAPPSTAARPSAFPAWKSLPFTPSLTSSRMPPRSAATTGTPRAKASRIASGWFSTHRDGTTATSHSGMKRGRLGRLECPMETDRQSTGRPLERTDVLRPLIVPPVNVEAVRIAGKLPDGADQDVHTFQRRDGSGKPDPEGPSSPPGGLPALRVGGPPRGRRPPSARRTRRPRRRLADTSTGL